MNIYMISGQDYQRTDHGKFSLKYEGTKLWNTLPENLKKMRRLYAYVANKYDLGNRN